MIFITVGTQLNFDRLIGYVDSWVKSRGVVDVEIFAQVGDSVYQTDSFETVKFVGLSDYQLLIERCDLIVSHAGMGSILTALEWNIPLIIFPRDVSLGEHRNAHQLATCKSFSGSPGVYVAETEEELFKLLDHRKKLNSGTLVPSFEYEKLLDEVSSLLTL
jgi:UDP-N-acetylglucosamine transferase subunit ALG13